MERLQKGGAKLFLVVACMRAAFMVSAKQAYNPPSADDGLEVR